MDLRSGHPYWLIKDGLLATYPSLRQDASCDVAIIGAGITAALVAYAFCREGVHTIAVDERDVAAGSTAASTALLQHAADTELLDLAATVGASAAVRSYRLGLESVDKLEGIVAALGDDCGFSRKQSLYLASAKKDVPPLRNEFDFRRRNGFAVEFLEQADIESQFAFSAPAAIFTSGDGQIDAYRFCHRLFQYAVTKGAQVFDRTKVADIRPGRNGVTLKTTTGFRITARRVVFATGYESQRYLKQNVGTLHSTFAVITEPVESFPKWAGRCLIWETARPYCYLRATDDDRILIGGKDTPFATAHRQDSLVKKKSAQLAHRLQRMFPETDFEIAYSWAGTFGATSDGLAYIGGTPEWPHADFAIGYGGNGITMSVTAAEIIVDRFFGRQNPDAKIFAFDR
jgi:glycine/D-amino acid oxidase-like deaminating enzyme